jgi:hypothetical protein
MEARGEGEKLGVERNWSRQGWFFRAVASARHTTVSVGTLHHASMAEDFGACPAGVAPK